MPFLEIHSGVRRDKSKPANSGFSSRTCFGDPVSQGKALHSCASGRQMAFEIPSLSSAGAQPSFVVWRVRWRGEVTMRSILEWMSLSCGARDAACFLPRGVSGASWTYFLCQFSKI